MTAAAPTFFDLLLGIYRDLGQLRDGIATGGSATTLIDTGVTGQDDDWNQGPLFILEDAGGAGAAPEGQYAEVTDWDKSTSTFTVATSAFTVAPAANDVYAVASNKYPLDQMESVANRGLARLGDLPQIDTSLSSSGSLERYTLPVATVRRLERVFYRLFSTTDDEEPQEVVGWRVAPNGELILREAMPGSKTIELHYMAPHARLNTYDDALNSWVPLERAIAEGVYLALRDRDRATDGTDRTVARQFTQATEELREARRRFPIPGIGHAIQPLMPNWTTDKAQRRHKNKYGPYVLS